MSSEEEQIAKENQDATELTSNAKSTLRSFETPEEALTIITKDSQ